MPLFENRISHTCNKILQSHIATALYRLHDRALSLSLIHTCMYLCAACRAGADGVGSCRVQDEAVGSAAGGLTVLDELLRERVVDVAASPSDARLPEVRLLPNFERRRRPSSPRRTRPWWRFARRTQEEVVVPALLGTLCLHGGRITCAIRPPQAPTPFTTTSISIEERCAPNVLLFSQNNYFSLPYSPSHSVHVFPHFPLLFLSISANFHQSIRKRSSIILLVTASKLTSMSSIILNSHRIGAYLLVYSKILCSRKALTSPSCKLYCFWFGNILELACHKCRYWGGFLGCIHENVTLQCCWGVHFLNSS